MGMRRICDGCPNGRSFRGQKTTPPYKLAKSAIETDDSRERLLTGKATRLECSVGQHSHFRLILLALTEVMLLTGPAEGATSLDELFCSHQPESAGLLLDKAHIKRNRDDENASGGGA
jgi:hypothetical protein